MPRRGVFYDRYPQGAVAYRWGNVPYYCHDGIFYRPFNGGYVTVGAPIGFRFNILPFGFSTIYTGGYRYYYHHGNYYADRGGYYETVAPPVGALVESIPDGYERFEIDGNTYYRVDGVEYMAVLVDGEIWYQVIR
jgi:hypothetical protein